MMLPAEWYYEEKLKGKSAEEIMTAIRNLKWQIGHLKNIMEHPDYIYSMVDPDESLQLHFTRAYLEKAKEALEEAGGEYKPSQAELNAVDFNENLDYVEKLIFSIGGYFGGYETRTYTLRNDRLYMDINHSLALKPSNFHIEPDYPLTKEDLLMGLFELHIGEWRRTYNTQRFGYHVLDGTQWELEIHYSNGHKPFKVDGDNAYPYNFNEFQELLGIDPYDEEESEHEELVSSIINYLLELPDGTEISTYEALEATVGCTVTEEGYCIDGTIYDTDDLFDIDEQLRIAAEDKGIVLGEPEDDGMATGLPFHYPYIVKNNKGKD